jgi:F-type H+-transporting ATPase subunit delta
LKPTIIYKLNVYSSSKLNGFNSSKRLLTTLKEISTVKVISAQPLSKEDQEKIIKIASSSVVGFKNIELETVVDESLVGGFIIEMEDYVYDASVKNQIFRLKKSFAENLYESKIIAR